MAAAAVGQPDAYPSVHRITWEALAKCGARTRSGRPCRGLVVTGTTPLSNARRRTWLRRPFGNRNACGMVGVLVRPVSAAPYCVWSRPPAPHSWPSCGRPTSSPGETNVDQAVQTAAQQRQRLRRAAEVMQGILLRVGHSDEAVDLASEIAAIISP